MDVKLKLYSADSEQQSLTVKTTKSLPFSEQIGLHIDLHEDQTIKSLTIKNATDCDMTEYRIVITMLDNLMKKNSSIHVTSYIKGLIRGLKYIEQKRNDYNGMHFSDIPKDDRKF